MAEGEQPKIIIDSDWKAQAQAEKQRLAAEEEKRAAESPRQGRGGQSGMPPPDFRTLVGMLATQALMYMGAIPDEQGRAMVSLEVASHYIDLLATLEEKTKGNLDEEESEELTGVVQELRARFVQLTGLVEKAEREQAAGGKAGPGKIDLGPGGTT